MTQFSSGKHTDLTADPYPWVHPNGGRIPRRYGSEPFDTLAPRPEFDRPLTNPVNPILEDVRTYRAERMRMNNPKGWDHVLRAVISALRQGDYTGDEATDANAEHALKVLQRLVAVFG